MKLPIEDIELFVALGGTHQTHLTGPIKKWPDLWVVPPSAIIAENEIIEIPERTKEIKPAAELTAVIGDRIENADEQEAWEAIKGFTISNDVTASGEWPAWSKPEHPTGTGYKIFSTFSPILTSYVPKKELSEYQDLKNTVRVDGELSVEGSTAALSSSIPELVSFASQIVPLEENAVVALGDPGNPDILLDNADSVTCKMESIGELTNSVRTA